MTFKHLSLLTVIALGFTACEDVPELDEATPTAQAQVKYVDHVDERTFTEPDIRNDFCGVHINFQFCKCAFHNQYCGSVNHTQDSANSFVQAEFTNYVTGLKEPFNDLCIAGNGYVDGSTCFVCPEGSTVDGNRCKEVQAVAQVSSVTSSTAEVDCKEVTENWEKYSDIDWRIPTEERSFEAKNYAQVQDKLVATAAEQAELQYETELLRTQLADIKDYKAALVDNLRDNLVKATLRLAYVTYSQVNGAKGVKGSYEKIFTGTESLEKLGASMKIVQAMVPKGSQLEIDTNSAGGKVKSIGWNATLEAIESMGDPSAIAQQVAKDSKGALVPGADITPEEVEILRQQNLENNLLDEVIAEMEQQIADNEAWLTVADARITELKAERDTWLNKEEERVALLFVEQCE